MTASPPPNDVLFVSADLFLGSRVRAAADSQGRVLTVAASGSMAFKRLQESAFRLVIIDLETPGVDVSQLVQQRGEAGLPRFLAYGPHVRAAMLKAARDAGCDEVLTRGQFDATMNDILGRPTP